MRDFRFRAWHKDAKEMFQSRQQGYQGNVFQWLAEGQPIEIMQYTGLKDKNGKEIYEGDIVKYIATNNHEGKEFLHTIEWHEEGMVCGFKTIGIGDRRCRYNLCHNQIYNHKIEIVGNIYESPELLEKAND